MSGWMEVEWTCLFLWIVGWSKDWSPDTSTSENLSGDVWMEKVRKLFKYVWISQQTGTRNALKMMWVAFRLTAFHLHGRRARQWWHGGMVHVRVAIFGPVFLGQLQGAKNPCRSSTWAAGHRQSLSRSSERVGDMFVWFELAVWNDTECRPASCGHQVFTLRWPECAIVNDAQTSNYFYCWKFRILPWMRAPCASLSTASAAGCKEIDRSTAKKSAAANAAATAATHAAPSKKGPAKCSHIRFPNAEVVEDMGCEVTAHLRFHTFFWISLTNEPMRSKEHSISITASTISIVQPIQLKSMESLRGFSGAKATLQRFEGALCDSDLQQLFNLQDMLDIRTCCAVE